MLFDRRRALPQVNRDILDVADYIREHGWCQRWYMTPDGVCVLGAIYALGIGNDREMDAGHFLQDRIGRIGEWNDAFGRTKEEVIAKLEEIGWGG